MPFGGFRATLLLLLLHLAAAEPASGPQCPNGQSWSSDLDKCMNCALCKGLPKSDYCDKCDAITPKENQWLWPILGSALGAGMLLFLIIGFILIMRCKKKEKFTTPIEETGGHSPEESLLH